MKYWLAILSDGIWFGAILIDSRYDSIYFSMIFGAKGQRKMLTIS